MKRLINPAPPLAVKTDNPPLTVLLTIEVAGEGTLTQSQDSTRGLWKPDRTLHPLVLSPKFEAANPVTASKPEIQASHAWYVGEVSDAWDSATGTGHVQALGGAGGAEYYLETDDGTAAGNPTGRLVVRKNVDYRSARKVILVSTFTDTARGDIYTERAEFLLSSENRPDDFFSVRLQCPNTVRYNPLGSGSSLRTVRAVARLGQSDVSSQVKFFWMLDGTLIDGSMPCYDTGNQPSGKGQGTNTIVIDMDCIDDATLSVAIGDSLSAATPVGYAVDACSLMWDWPRLELVPYSMGARHVKETDASKTFGSIVRADGVDVTAAKRAEYLRQQWWTRPTSIGSVKTYHGWGEEAVIEGATLRQQGAVNTDVNADLCLLSPLGILTDDNDVPLTDDSGSSTASAYGGYAVGRV